ncbi:MAG: hypothetical protein GW949_06365 [Spirochaetales bacterium]|nr:hypothetical protein [Spirochaetales bacterium]
MRGADWTCSFCGTDNRASLDSCRQCGATKGDSQARAQKELSNSKETKPPAPRNRKPLILGTSLLAALGLGFLLWGLFAVKEIPLVVEEAG